MAESGVGPLSGIRVIDLTNWMAGPIAGMLLADLGADVIKVEGANGDPSRASRAGAFQDLRPGTPEPLSWATCNRNKRSVVLDLGDPAARPIFDRLLETADVLVTNMHQRTLENLKVDEASVHAINPKIVYSISAGLGHTGPRQYDHTQDMTGMAYAGLLFTYSSQEGKPFAPPGAMNDVLTGTMVAFGTLAALMQRQQTGEGQTVAGSLVQTSLWQQVLNVGTLANTSQEALGVSNRDQPRSALVNQYKAGDGKWFSIAGIMARYWPVFIEAVGIEHIAADPRFTAFEDMQKNSAELVKLLDQHFLSAPADHWIERMLAKGLWCGRCNTLQDVFTDEHIAANGYLTQLDDGSRTVTMPFTLMGYTPPTEAGPKLGEHTDEVLKELGFSTEGLVAAKPGRTR